MPLIRSVIKRSIKEAKIERTISRVATFSGVVGGIYGFGEEFKHSSKDTAAKFLIAISLHYGVIAQDILVQSKKFRSLAPHRSLDTFTVATSAIAIMCGSTFYIGNQVGRLFAKSIQDEGSIRD